MEDSGKWCKMHVSELSKPGPRKLKLVSYCYRSSLSASGSSKESSGIGAGAGLWKVDVHKMRRGYKSMETEYHSIYPISKTFRHPIPNDHSDRSDEVNLALNVGEILVNQFYLEAQSMLTLSRYY